MGDRPSRSAKRTRSMSRNNQTASQKQLWADVAANDSSLGVDERDLGDLTLNSYTEEVETSQHLDQTMDSEASSQNQQSEFKPVASPQLLVPGTSGMATSTPRKTSGTEQEDAPTDQLISAKLATFIGGAQKTFTLVERVVYDHLNTISRMNDEQMRIDAQEKFNNSEAIKTHYARMSANLKEAVNLLKLRTQMGKNQQIQLDTGKPSGLRPTAMKGQKKRTEGRFILHMKPKTKQVLNSLAIFNDAVRKIALHVDDTKPEGAGQKIVFRYGEDLANARKALDAHSHGTQKVVDLYYFEEEVRSDYLIRTQTFGRGVLSELPFTVDGKINQSAANATLLDRNDEWFKDQSDIISVEVHTIPRKPYDVFLLDIYLAKEAYGRVAEGIKEKMNLDCEAKQLQVFVPTHVETCLRCHSPNHHATNCNNEVKCKWCISKHLDGEQCASKANPTCYRCREFNMNLAPGGTKRDESHHAASPRCPDIRAARGQASKRVIRPKASNASRRAR